MDSANANLSLFQQQHEAFNSGDMNAAAEIGRASCRERVCMLV